MISKYSASLEQRFTLEVVLVQRGRFNDQLEHFVLELNACRQPITEDHLPGVDGRGVRTLTDGHFAPVLIIRQIQGRRRYSVL